MYIAVCVGVNKSPLSEVVLRFAEKDAEEVCSALASDQGPLRGGGAKLLRGAEATSQAIRDALMWAAAQNPVHFLFFFSGHGGEDGLGSASGLLEFEQLHRALQFIGAPNALVILDSCRAASFIVKEGRVVLGGVTDISWMEALTNATPGLRLLFSTGAPRDAGENAEMGNGIFTGALLSGMRNGGPTIRYNGSGFVSDETAFNYARLHMKRVQRSAQVPESRGLTGDFPMLRSEKSAWIGEGSISKACILPHGLDVEATLLGRKFVKTRFSYRVVNIGGEVLHEDEQILDARRSEYVFFGLLPFDAGWLYRNRNCRLQMLAFGAVSFWWHVQLFDGANDLLDESWVSARYPLRG